MRSICAHVRPDRQTLLFSATFPRRVEKLARDALRDPLRIQHGDAGEASADVQQSVMFSLFDANDRFIIIVRRYCIDCKFFL